MYKRQGDKSLLLINSGMAPMKKYFTGEVTPPRNRVTTCQKCIRTPDIERVGITARHGTYFEMLGNFSFGDYFKHEATAWAWEFCTKVLELPVERIWVSIYQDDDEAFDIWTKEVGVDPSRIVRLGKEDNFWEHGTGPCGPCSELYFDRGEEYGCGSPTCGVGCDCDRYVEFWNLVFSQFDNDGQGNYTPLEHKNIDTGMGLERLACIMQGVDNLFLVDTVQNIMKHISKIAGVEYGADPKTDISLRVVTDHIRSTTFMIGEMCIRDRGRPEKEANRLAEKKAIEDARFVLPNACNTKMICTMNARSLMNFFTLRCCNRAQWEIRDVADQMYRLVYAAAPKLFQNAGPSCVRGACSEGKMSCGKMREVRERFAAMREQCHGKG